MKFCLRLFIGLGCVLGVLSACAGPSKTLLHGDMAVTNVASVDVKDGSIKPGQTILMSAGRITHVVDTGDNPLAPSVRIIDGADHMAMPGLWDAHTHVIGDVSGDIQALLGRYLGYGITHLRDMGAAPETFKSFAAASPGFEQPTPYMLKSQGKIVGQILPWGQTDQWALIETPDDAPAVLAAQKEAGADFFKIYGPISPEKYKAVAAASRDLDMPIAGQIPFQISLDDVIAARPQSVEHIGFVMNGCGLDGQSYFNRTINARFNESGENQHAILPEYVKALDWETCRAKLRAMGEAGIAWTPTLSVFAGYGPWLDPEIRSRFAADTMCTAEDDAFTAGGDVLEASVLEALEKLISEFKAAGITILAGSDAETFCLRHGASYAGELRLLERAGLSHLEVLQSATIHQARQYDLDARFGEIAPGRAADFILLDGSPLEDLSVLSAPAGMVIGRDYLDRTALAARRGG